MNRVFIESWNKEPNTIETQQKNNKRRNANQNRLLETKNDKKK